MSKVVGFIRQTPYLSIEADLHSITDSNEIYEKVVFSDARLVASLEKRPLEFL